MKTFLLVLLFFILSFISFAQKTSNDYILFIKEANSFFEAKDFLKAAESYSSAFESNNGVAMPSDRYNAARAYALSAKPDSAFFHLYRLARNNYYKDYLQITNDTCIILLHNDKRYIPLLEIIKENILNAEKKLNKPLTELLDSIFYRNQHFLFMIDSVEQLYGNDSKEVQVLLLEIHKNDSLNVIKVSAIIEKYGWLGSEIVGEQGNSTLFLVIQQASLLTQEKYLPKLSEAYENGKASGQDLALLTDLIERHNSRSQIYGTQVIIIDGKYIVYPISDEINVNRRRAAIGLQPLKIYLKKYNIDYLVPTK